VARTILSNPITAWFSIYLRCGLLEDVLDMWPSGGGTTRHEGRTISRTLFTTGNTGSDKEEAFLFEILCTTNGIGEVRIATVDDDIALFEIRDQLVDEIVNCDTSLDE
jgi:hypothetical protein